MKRINKRQEGGFNCIIIHVEKQLVEKHMLKLEIAHMRGLLNAMKHLVEPLEIQVVKGKEREEFHWKKGLVRFLEGNDGKRRRGMHERLIFHV